MSADGTARGNVAEVVERRADQRTATVFRPALIETEDFAGFCLVRNLSENGMKGRVYTQFTDASVVTIQFHPELTVRGTIIWSNGNEVGVEFAESIDVCTTLATLGSGSRDGKINRAPRLPIQAEAEIIARGRPIFAEVQDISQRGVKVRASSLYVGDEVMLSLEGMEPRKAIVRWCQLNMAGLNFLRPLGFDQLAEWVIWHQTRESPNAAQANS